MKQLAALFVFFILCPILASVTGWWTLIPLAAAGLWLTRKEADHETA